MARAFPSCCQSSFLLWTAPIIYPMTDWTREFIEGRIVYVIRPDAGDFHGAADTVFQLLPTLLTGEEIRIHPAVKPAEATPALPWEADGL